MGARVILFIDPDPAVLDRIKPSGADGVEIYTGSYAAAFLNGLMWNALNIAIMVGLLIRARQRLVVA